MRKRICLAVVLTVCGFAALPEAPHQHDPWTAPLVQGLPDFVASTTAALFDAGLADPRGGEYREITLERAVTKEVPPVVTHGWSFGNGWAVCWNGLMYRVGKVGRPADLEVDVKAIGGIQTAGPMVLLDGFPEFLMGLEGMDHVATPLALLLRLGRADLALHLSPPLGSNLAWTQTTETAWLSAAFHRMLGDRGRNEDAASVDIGESILTWQSRIVSKRLKFLEPVPVLLADSRRRMSQAPRPPLAEGSQVTIAELIDRLEDVHGDKLTYPGSLEYSFDPVFDRLAKEGDAAVESLLDAYEFDKRLTRTCDYSRPWSMEYTPISVKEVARLLLSQITQIPSVLERSTPAELRAWWRTNRRGN